MPELKKIVKGDKYNKEEFLGCLTNVVMHWLGYSSTMLHFPNVD
jgi:hypothetical protein